MSDPKYIIRILRCPNPQVHNTFVESFKWSEHGCLSVQGGGDFSSARVCSHEEVRAFLRHKENHLEVEVLLRTEEPKSIEGWVVGTRLLCTLSGSPCIIPGQQYEVHRIDARGRAWLVRYGHPAGVETLARAEIHQTHRNEYKVIES